MFNSPQESREILQSSEGTEGSECRRAPEIGFEDLHLYNILFILATFLSLASIFLTYAWGVKYCGGYSLDTVQTEVNWHPLLTLIGFVIPYAQAFLFDQTGKNLSRWCGTFIPNSIIFWCTLMMKLVGFIMVVFGLHAAFDFGNVFNPTRPHIFTLHSWIGLGAVVLLSLDILIDFKWFFLDKMSDLQGHVLMMFSWMIGTMTFVMSINSCITGFMEDALFMYPVTYADLPAGAIYLNLIGLLVLLFGVIVLHLSRKMREIGDFTNVPGGLDV